MFKIMLEYVPMRKVPYIVLGLSVALFVLWNLAPSFNQGFVASAAPTSTIVQSLIVKNLGGAGILCLHTNNSGYISTSTADCGTGGGSSGTATTSIGGLVGSDFVIRPTSTLGVTTSTSPNTIWFGPDQLYYLASNPNAFITATSTKFDDYYLASNPNAFITATSTKFNDYYLASNPNQFLTATTTAFN